MARSLDVEPTLLQAVGAVFGKLGEPAPEEEVLSFLTAAAGEEDCEPEDLSELLATHSPAYGALPPAQQLQCAQGLLAQAAQLRSTATGPSAPKPQEPAALVADCLGRLGLSRGSSGGSSNGSNPEGTDAAASSSAQEQQAVEALQAVCGEQLPPGFLRYVHRTKGGGSLDAAAGWLLEASPGTLAAEQQLWASERQRQEAQAAQAAQEQQLLRRQLVERFHLQAVPSGPPGGGCKPRQQQQQRPAVRAWGAADENRSRARYLEGQLVSSKGEKYVTVKVGEEWDGGSRGKVMTKGKRGKGFV